MTQIINGLQLDVSAEELKSLFAGRISYHDNKVSKYEKVAAGLEKIDLELEEEADDIGKYSNTTVSNDTIKTSIRKHKNQSRYFKFMSEHVIANSTYRLTNTDLQLLGVMDRGY
jgi:hypothetical protein